MFSSRLTVRDCTIIAWDKAKKIEIWLSSVAVKEVEKTVICNCKNKEKDKILIRLRDCLKRNIL